MWEGIERVLIKYKVNWTTRADIVDDVLSYLHSQGVVIKVDKELPELDAVLISHAKGDASYELQDELKNWNCERDGKRMNDADWIKWREPQCILARYAKELDKAGYVAVKPLVEV